MVKNKLKELEELTADAGYGSEESYELLEQKNITPFVKYNTFDKEQNAHNQPKNKTFNKENQHYHREEDFTFARWDKKWKKCTKAPEKPRYISYKNYPIIRRKTAKKAYCEVFVTTQKKTGAWSATII